MEPETAILKNFTTVEPPLQTRVYLTIVPTTPFENTKFTHSILDCRPTADTTGRPYAFDELLQYSFNHQAYGREIVCLFVSVSFKFLFSCCSFPKYTHNATTMILPPSPWDFFF